MEGVYLLCQTTHDTEKYFASATFTPLLKKLLCCVEEYLSCHCSLVINYLYFGRGNDINTLHGKSFKKTIAFYMFFIFCTKFDD